MSSTRYEPSLRIEPQPSVILKWFLIANFLGATLIVFIVFPVAFALTVSILLWLYFYLLYHRLILQRAPETVRLLVRETTGDWLLHTFDGAEQVVTLSPSSYIHPQLIILILQSEHRRYSLPLLRDSLSVDCFRSLSVWLRMKSGAKL